MPDLVTRMAPATHVIGIDEVGRGCLMGPLAVAAVINPLGWRHAEVKDSKAIRSERKRYRIAENIVQNVVWNLVEVQPHVINEVGISKALESAYVMALGDILDRRRSFASAGVCEIILDGLMMEGVYQHFHAPGRVHVTAMVGADAQVFESSCASLIAKAARDKWCHDIVKSRPELALYHVETNKGYDSPNHTAALIQHGLSDQHRVLFCQTRLTNEAAKRKRILTMTLANGTKLLIGRDPTHAPSPTPQLQGT